MTTLHSAVNEGDVVRVQAMLTDLTLDEARVQLSELDVDGKTPLQLAVDQGDVEVLKLILEHPGTDVNLKSKRGSLAIHVAAYKGHVECLELLLQHEGTSDVCVKNNELFTPIHLACLGNRVDCLSLLLHHPSVKNLSMKSVDGYEAIHYCSEKGHANCLRLLLQHTTSGTIDICTRADCGSTPLHLATQNNHVECLALLLQHPSALDVSIRGDCDDTPIHVACEKGNINCLRLLMEHSSVTDVNIRGHAGFYPIHYAVQKGHLECLKDLLMHSSLVDVSMQTQRGVSSLHFAAERGDLEILLLLLKHPSTTDINIKNNSGRTPLHFAVDSKIDCLTAILKHPNVDVSVIDNFGDTPSHRAISNKNTAFLSLLLDHMLKTSDQVNADIHAMLKTEVNCVDDSGTSTLVHAVSNDLVDVTCYLLSYDVKDTLKALDLALQKEYRACACVLYLASHLDEDIEKLLILLCDFSEVSIIEAITLAPIRFSFLNRGLIKLLLLLSSHRKFNKGVLVPGSTAYKSILNILSAKYYSNWITLLTSSSSDFGSLEYSVKFYVSHYPQLMDARDMHGRQVTDLASPRIKEAINSVFLWFGRYKVDTRPEHMSSTCYVYLGTDELDKDDHGKGRRVALKLMRFQDQFMRELSARKADFDSKYVIEVVRCHIGQLELAAADCNENELTSILGSQVNGGVIESPLILTHAGILTKEQAEALYTIVMPCADRNMFVAMKQERFAGKDFAEVAHIFQQIVIAVAHIHSKGLLHADLKPLNIVRIDSRWLIIDLDASCVIDRDIVGVKSSSGYAPPEAVEVSANPVDTSPSSSSPSLPSSSNATTTTTTTTVAVATIGKKTANIKNPNSDNPLTAHPSLDVWSLGCLLYQLCHPDAQPLWYVGRDDNLSDASSDSDNLFSLARWDAATKERKLEAIVHSQARNLISQMLTKDSTRRPTLERILNHPFITNRKAVRMVGEAALWDVFISYRVASEAAMALLLYVWLTNAGLKVYLDSKCLKDGLQWEQGFCEGLVNSSVFLPLLSKSAINHPTIKWQNFSQLAEDSNCDNVLLEHRLALELEGIGLIQRIFPIMIGDVISSEGEPNTCTNPADVEYSHFFSCGGSPKCDNICVEKVEAKTREHLETAGLGSPLCPRRTVQSVYSAITGFQGHFIIGNGENALKHAVTKVRDIVMELKSDNAIQVPIELATSVKVEDGSSPTRQKTDLVTRLRAETAKVAEIAIITEIAEIDLVARLQAQIDAQTQEIRRRDVELERLRSHLSDQTLASAPRINGRDNSALPTIPNSFANYGNIPVTAETAKIAERERLQEHLYRAILQTWDAASIASTSND